MLARSFLVACSSLALSLAFGGSAAAQPIIVAADPPQFVEGTVATVALNARFAGAVSDHEWIQVSGPLVPRTEVGPQQVILDVSALSVAVDVELVFELDAVVGGNPESASVSVHVQPADIVSMLGPNTQIGGSSTDVVKQGGYAFYNVGGRLCSTPIGTSAGPVYSIPLAGFIRDILLVEFKETRYALVAMGSEGIAVVDVDDPTAMEWRFDVQINYFQDDLTWAEGGGDILVDQVISGTRGTISALATDGVTLWIGNADYGLHRTALKNLLQSTGPALESDGTLLVENEVYTLLYAGEVPWGAPLSIERVADRLFVAREFLGLAIYNAVTLKQVGYYNLYTDVAMEEDWFLDLDVAQAVQPGFLDAATGMPDHRQASYELLASHGGGGSATATPWADFDRYGKYYYNSRKVAVQRFEDRTLAFIAYGLGGLVAVDVSGFRNATVSKPVKVKFVGYVPAVPAHGPDEFIGSHSEQILPHFGSGMLKESGIVDVAIRGQRAIATDHFAGLFILRGANRPEKHWRGTEFPYDNDNGIVGDHVPDYEFVTSFDMSPFDPNDHESLPAWMYQTPCLLVIGEIAGHGGAFVAQNVVDLDAAGEPDVLLCQGSGGFGFIDVVDLDAPDMASRFTVPAYFPTTDEIGAAPDGTPTQTISIGHTGGLAATEGYLYVADGPHGVSAWKLLDANGFVADEIHLVANSIQDEYPVEVGATTLYPATHAAEVVYHEASRSAMTLCQGVGLRRVGVGSVEDGLGAIGAPLLLAPSTTDIFEHNGEAGKIPSVPKQDHAYDVAIDGDLAYVADGGNGLTIYDLSKDPSVLSSGFFVSNLGGATQQEPLLGRTTGIALWDGPGNSKYALMAAGPRGVGVVDVTDPANPDLVKVFEPIKMEDEKVGKADGRCVDVYVDDDRAYFTYDSFGIVCYDIDDLVAPLPGGVDPTDIWEVQGDAVVFDYRPIAVGEYRLRDEVDYADYGGGALGMTATHVGGQRILYVAYGVAGFIKVDATDPTAMTLVQLVPTQGDCEDIAIASGRLFAADGAGGLAAYR